MPSVSIVNCRQGMSGAHRSDLLKALILIGPGEMALGANVDVSFGTASNK